MKNLKGNFGIACILNDRLMAHAYNFLTIEEAVEEAELQNRYRPVWAFNCIVDNSMNILCNIQEFKRKKKIEQL